MENIFNSVEWKEIEYPANVPKSERYATHQGVLELPFGDETVPIRCYQLNTGQRLLDAEDVQQLILIGRPTA